MKIQSALPVKASVSSRGGYHRLLSEISGIITQGRAIALRHIDTTQAITYWHVGRRIVEFYQNGAGRAEYGQQVLIKLSRDLSVRFGKGYSVDNLQNMRRLYVEFPKLAQIYETVSRKSYKTSFPVKYETPSRILSWSHYCELLKEDNIILCSKKSEIYAKYVLGNLNNKIFASKYKLALPTEKELHQRLRLPHQGTP